MEISYCKRCQNYSIKEFLEVDIIVNLIMMYFFYIFVPNGNDAT